MAPPKFGGGLVDPVFSSGDCRTINIKNARNHGFDFFAFPVTETTSDNTPPSFDGGQADSVPASIDAVGTAGTSIPTYLKTSLYPLPTITDSHVLPNHIPSAIVNPFDRQLASPYYQILPFLLTEFERPPESTANRRSFRSAVRLTITSRSHRRILTANPHRWLRKPRKSMGLHLWEWE